MLRRLPSRGLVLASKTHTLVCLGIYAMAGVAWLSLAYRESLRPLHQSTTVEAVDAEAAVRRLGVPWKVAGVLALFLALAGAVFAVDPNSASLVLWELMPTSGGTGEYARRARGGVNDGDEETSGKNANSTGMVETDQFLESPLPSLYDAVSDMYGAPHKPPKDAEATQALGAVAKEKHGRASDSLRPSPSFPTSRKPPGESKTPLSRAARGLFEIEGPTPLHIRAAIFDRFDGLTWTEAPPPAPSLPRRDVHSNWMNWSHAASPHLFAEVTVRHSFKIAKLDRGESVGSSPAASTLDGTLLPTAPHVVKFRLGKIDQERYFSCGSDGILRMAIRKVPSGTTLTIDSRVPDPRALAELRLWPIPIAGSHSTGASDSSRVAKLAQEWAGNRPRGWAQIEAIIQRLRGEFALDASVSVPPDRADAAEYFLFESRRGPDYLFATSATALLHHLGYRMRLVAGFYATPTMYDPETKHTPVGRENLHVWPEVFAGESTWLVLEPTPGYDLPLLPQSWSDRVLGALSACGSWIVEHPAFMLILLSSLVASI